MFFKRVVPVYLAGMWPSTSCNPANGTTVAILEREGGPSLLDGFSDELGEFRGTLPSTWVGRDALVVVRKPGFIYHYFNPVKVERWGLFLAVRQEKDRVYIGSKGARTTDPQRWDTWNATAEHIKASERIQSAVRRVKLAWPLRPLGLVIAVILGIAGFFVHPAVGLVAGLLAFVLLEWLADYLSTHGY